MARFKITRDDLSGNFVCAEVNGEPGSERRYLSIDILVKTEFQVYLEIGERVHGQDHSLQSTRTICDKIAYTLLECGEYEFSIPDGMGLKNTNKGMSDERKIDRKT